MRPGVRAEGAQDPAVLIRRDDGQLLLAGLVAGDQRPTEDIALGNGHALTGLRARDFHSFAKNSSFGHDITLRDVTRWPGFGPATSALR